MRTLSFPTKGHSGRISSRILILPAVFLALLTTAFCPPNAFSDCTDYGKSFGLAYIPGVASEVAVSGSYAFVAAGAAGLQVVDISSPDSPVVVGGVDTP